jgi:hypothetical protein
MERNGKERFFSVELKSKINLKNVTLCNGSHENVLVEGSIGHLKSAEFAEGIILQVIGTEGILRVNLKDREIKRNENKGGEPD